MIQRQLNDSIRSKVNGEQMSTIKCAYDQAILGETEWSD